MKLPSQIAVAGLSLLMGRTASATDATTPVDYTQRNTPFAPAASITPEKKEMARDAAWQNKRVDPVIVDQPSAAIGDRRATVRVEETRDKLVREKQSTSPAGVEQPMSIFNHRESGIATASDTKKPPTVAKFQNSLTAASASNMARFPALDGGTTARINRFVFRKNGSEASAKTAAPITGGASVISAAGGSAVLK